MADDTRLEIQAFTAADYSGSATKKFTVMFNPDSYSKKFEADYGNAQSQGSSGSPQTFQKLKPKEMTFEFVIDGTNAVKPIDLSTEELQAARQSDPEMSVVEAKVEEFRQTCFDMEGSTHRPYYLYLVWGDLFLYCVLKSADIKYTLFTKEGNALRAKISATFVENESDTLRERRERKSSPDLTHIRIVKQGEILPLMCYEIYGNSNWFQEVAKVNNLKNYRQLKPGMQLIFPPIDKTNNS